MIIIAKQNEGKVFERAVVASIPDYCWHKRLNDNAASWGNGTQTRFTSTNECDFLLFDCNTRTLSALELKTTSGSLTYWREDFEEKESTLIANISKLATSGSADAVNQQAKLEQELAQLENELQVLRDKKNSFLSGDNSIYYMRKLNFLMDPILHSQFLPIDEAQIRKEMFGDKKQSDLTEEDSLKFW